MLAGIKTRLTTRDCGNRQDIIVDSPATEMCRDAHKLNSRLRFKNMHIGCDYSYVNTTTQLVFDTLERDLYITCRLSLQTIRRRVKNW